MPKLHTENKSFTFTHRSQGGKFLLAQRNLDQMGGKTGRNRESGSQAAPLFHRIFELSQFLSHCILKPLHSSRRDPQGAATLQPAKKSQQLRNCRKFFVFTIKFAKFFIYTIGS